MSEVAATYAWDTDAALYDALELAGWRYAVLIGITNPDPDESFPQSMRDADAKKYAHFIRRTEDGGYLWVEKEATTFVCDVTSVSREIAAAWLDYEWQGGGEV